MAQVGLMRLLGGRCSAASTTWVLKAMSYEARRCLTLTPCALEVALAALGRGIDAPVARAGGRFSAAGKGAAQGQEGAEPLGEERGVGREEARTHVLGDLC